MNTAFRNETVAEPRGDFLPWHVSWSGTWVGALASIAMLLCLGLVATALGAHLAGPRNIADYHNADFRWVAAIYSVFASFLSFVVGGWVAGKVSGYRASENAMLHGALAWLLALPLILCFATFGGATLMAGSYDALSGTPAWAARHDDASASSAATDETTQAARQRRADATRDAALGTLTSVLLGLAGGVIGGWMASGEPMTLGSRRQVAATGRPIGQSVHSA